MKSYPKSITTFNDVDPGNYAVFKSSDGWCIIRKGSKKASKTKLKKSEAVAFAERFCKRYKVLYSILEQGV